MARSRVETRTGGRPATTGVIAGDFSLSVGMPDKPAPSGWRWTPLTEVARLETGHTPSKKHPEYWGGDVAWLGIKDATENHGRVIFDTVQHTNELGIANSSARILPANTVCLSRTASVGYVVVMGRPMATSQDFVNWVCSERIDYRFLKYVLLAERAAFLRFASGTTHQTIYFPEVKAFHVCLPPLAEQRAIAHILGTLDDKIELNRRMSETLEAIARALFESWFVRFDPVRRNMARKGRGQPSPALRRPSPTGRGSEGERQQYRSGYDFSGLVETARELRKNHTPAETIFWELVRDRRFMGLKFRRQHQLGDYIADFYCHEHRLVVELDGGVHAVKHKKDHRRDAWMESQGYTVVRFRNQEVLEDTESVLAAIAQMIAPREKPPLPLGEGRDEDSVGGPHPLPLGEGWGEGSVEELDRLFPARLVDSELGEIPEGWGVATLPELIEVNPSRPLRKGQIAPYLDMANMPTRGHAPDEVIERPFGSGMRFINGDTLVARITPCLENGKTAFVDFLQDGQVGWGSTEYIVLRPRAPLPDEFAYCLARSDSFREFAIQSMTGTSGRQRVQTDSLAHFCLPRVPKPVAEAFGRVIKPAFARSSAAARESRTLAALRDTLLPKLISGELRVKDAEKFCQKAEA